MDGARWHGPDAWQAGWVRGIFKLAEKAHLSAAPDIPAGDVPTDRDAKHKGCDNDSNNGDLLHIFTQRGRR